MSAIIVADGLHVGIAAVRQHLHGPRQVVALGGRQVVEAVQRRGQQVFHVAGRERRHVHHLEARRGVAQQPVGPGRVACGEDETVVAGRQRRQQLLQHVAQTREAFERPQLERLVQEERAGFAAGRRGRGQEVRARRRRRRAAWPAACGRRATGTVTTR